MKALAHYTVKALGMPFRDFLFGMDKALQGTTNTTGRLAVLFACFGVSWWLYVPIHELLHAFGCLLGGGEVSRLEIGTIYGGGLLSEIFPFVVPGGEYAGRLSGFSTNNSDLVYLLTVFAPYVLTILLGVPLMRLSARGQGTPARAALFGISAPLAFAPFISLIGDYYEIGSIIISRLYAWFFASKSVYSIRGDDIFLVIKEVAQGAGGLGAKGQVLIAFAAVLGTGLAFATYWAGAAFGDLIKKKKIS